MPEKTYSLKEIIAKKIPILFYARNRENTDSKAELQNATINKRCQVSFDTAKLQRYLTDEVDNLIVVSATEFQECTNVIQSNVVSKQNGHLSMSRVNGPLKYLTANHTVFVKDIDKNVNLFYFLRNKLRTASFIFCSNERMGFKKVMEIGIAEGSSKHWLVEIVNERFGVVGSNYSLLKDFIIQRRDAPYLTDKVCMEDNEFYVLADEQKGEWMRGEVPREYEHRIRLYKLMSLVYAEEEYEMRCGINAYLRECYGLTEDDVFSSFVTSTFDLADDGTCSTAPITSLNPSDLADGKISIKSLKHLKMALTKQLLLLIQDVLTADLPSVLIGPTGTGKTSLLQRLFSPVVFNCSNDTDILDIMGNYRNEFKFVPGPFCDAVKNGSSFLFDEINLLNKECVHYVESVVRNGTFYNHLYETVSTSGTRVFGCMNREGKKAMDTNAFLRITVNDFSGDLDDVKLVVNSYDFDPGVFACKDRVALFYHEVSKRKKVSGRTLSRLLGSECTYLSVYTLFEEEYDGYKIDRDIMNYDYGWIASDDTSCPRNHAEGAVFSEVTAPVNSFGSLILTDTLKVLLIQLQFCIKNKLPILLYGETSTGKTSLIYHLSRAYGKNLVRINNHKDTDSSDYLGKSVIVKDKIIHSKGPLIRAMLNGDWLLIDEINLCSCDVLEVLNRLLDDNKEIRIPETGEIVRPSADFRIFATMNANYAGRNTLTDAFMNRFVVKEVKLNLKEVLKEEKYAFVIKLYDHLRVLRNFRTLITLRDVFKIARRTGDESVENVVWEYLGERQRDEKMKAMLRESVESCRAAGNVHAINDASRDASNGQFGDLIDRCAGAFSNFVFTSQHKKVMNLILKAWLYKEHVLLVGETGIGKTKMVEILSQVLGKPLTIVPCHGSMDTSDLIGQYEIGSGDVVFRESELVCAMREDGVILLDEINLPESSVVERLNSLLDSNMLYLTETGEVVHNRSLIIATMNPGTYAGKKELGDALRNRFTEIYFHFDDYVPIVNCLFKNSRGVPGSALISADDLIERICRFKDRLSIRKIERMVQFFGEGTNMVKREMRCLDGSALLEEACEIVGLSRAVEQKDCKLIDDGLRLGCYPYYIMKGARDGTDRTADQENNTGKENSTNIETDAINSKDTRGGAIRVINSFASTDTPFKFMTYNFYVLLRALFLSNNILIEGAPGLGKTTIVKQLGSMLDIPVERVNLNSCTEFSDLTGTFIPQNDKFVFVESRFIKALRANSIVILDEINLCTQSVIEGLNPLLDHRRALTVNNRVVTTESLIFGTMNPSSYKGRKALPKSFVDRFVHVRFEHFGANEVEDILGRRMARLKAVYGCTMRQCVRAKMLGENVIVGRDVRYRIEQGRVRVGRTVIERGCAVECGQACNSTSIEKNGVHGASGTVDMNYQVGNKSCERRNEVKKQSTVANEKITCEGKDAQAATSNGNNNLDVPKSISKYAFISKNVKHLESLINALSRRVPVILTGPGKSSLLALTAHLLNLKQVHIHLHAQIDTTDLLGQYEKCASSIFRWTDSPLVRSLNHDITVLHTPEKVDKSVLNRLNSLFDDNYLNLIEKGIDTHYRSTTRFVLFVDDVCQMSTPFVDRCVLIECADWSVLDYVKMVACWYSGDDPTVLMDTLRLSGTVESCGESTVGGVNNGSGAECGLNRDHGQNYGLDRILEHKAGQTLGFVVQKAQILSFLCGSRMNTTLLKDLHIKMRINTYKEMIEEVIASIEEDAHSGVYTDSQYIKDAITCVLQHISRGKYVLPNLVLEQHIKWYYNYRVVKMSEKENELIRSYNVIRSVDTVRSIEECVGVLSRDNSGFKEMMEYVDVLNGFGVVSVRELKERYLCSAIDEYDEECGEERDEECGEERDEERSEERDEECGEKRGHHGEGNACNDEICKEWNVEHGKMVGRGLNESEMRECDGNGKRIRSADDVSVSNTHTECTLAITPRSTRPRSLKELSFRDVLTFKDTHVKFNRALFNDLIRNDPLLLLVKECDVLPDIRRILIKMYKYGKTDDIGTVREFVREGQRKMKIREKLNKEMKERDFARFKNMVREIEACIERENGAYGFFRAMLGEQGLDMFVYYRLRIVKMLRRMKKRALEKHKRVLVQRYLTGDDNLNAYLPLIRGMPMRMLTRSYCAFFYATFFRKTCGTIHPFVVEAIGEGYAVCDGMLNEGIRDRITSRKGGKDEHAGITNRNTAINTAPVSDINYQILVHVITKDWQINTLEPFMLMYSYTHFRTVLFFLKELSISKHLLPAKELFYGMSLQYHTFNRDVREEVNALEVIKEVDMKYEVGCYKCCDAMERVHRMLRVEDSSGKGCWCVRVFRMGGLDGMRNVVQVVEQECGEKGGGTGRYRENGRVSDENQDARDDGRTGTTDRNATICTDRLDPFSFYNRTIPSQPYNSHEIALGQLFFKFNILKESVSPQLSALLILCFYYPYTPLIMYVSKAMDERDAWLVRDGREGGRGDVCEEVDDKSGEDENEDGEDGCGRGECEQEDNDGEVGCRTKEDEEKDEEMKDEIDEEKMGEEDNDGRIGENEQVVNKEEDDYDDETEKNIDLDELEKVDGEFNDGIEEIAEDGEGSVDRTENESCVEGENELSDGAENESSDRKEGKPSDGEDSLDRDDESILNDSVDESIADSSGELFDPTSSSENALDERTYRFEEGIRNDEQCCDEADNYEKGGCKEEGGSAKALCAEEGSNENSVGVVNVDDNVLNKGNVEEYAENAAADGVLNFDAEVDAQLTERVRSILFSRKAYKGDYRTGKKLNLKKIVQFIASDYQKDKIWYRKNGRAPTKIRLFIDNSRSMTHYNLQKLSFVYRRLYGAFKALDVPIELYKFGEDATLIQSPNDLPFDDGVTNYSFVEHFGDGVNIVLTDGIVNELKGKDNERFLFLIFNREILRMESVRYVGDRMIRSRYLDSVRFRYEVIGDVEEVEESILIALEEMVMND